MNNKEKLSQLYQEAVVNINGVITRAEDAKVSIFDRGFLYGDSIYEVTYSDDKSILFFDEHLDRLYHSASILNMHFFIDREMIIAETIKTLKHSGMGRAYIRIIVTRGETHITLDPNSTIKNNLIIICKPQPHFDDLIYQKGIKLSLIEITVNEIQGPDSHAKSGNYLNNVMAMNEAIKLGSDDAIMINKKGFITEGTTFNVWMVKDGILYTPPISSGILKGITREKVLDICGDHKIHLIKEPISPDHINQADEIFITSSTKGIMPVSHLDGRCLGNNIEDWPITKRITQLYREVVIKNKESKEYFYG